MRKVRADRVAEPPAGLALLPRAPSLMAAPLTDVMRSAAQVALELGPHVRGLAQEVFCVASLDTKNRVRAWALVSVGTIDSAIVSPRDVFRQAIVDHAAAVMLVHNHPSGDPEPSPEDVALTRRLVEAGRILGIPVLDHVVLGANAHVSFSDRGLI